MKICKSSLEAADGLITKMLDVESTDINSVVTEIEKFTNSGSTLKGDAWDKYRTVFSSYKDMLNNKKSVASQLASSMRSANSKMSSYLGGEDFIDDAELAELKINRKLLENDLESPNITDGQKKECSELITTIGQQIEKLEKLAPTDSAAYGIINVSTALLSAEDEF